MQWTHLVSCKSFEMTKNAILKIVVPQSGWSTFSPVDHDLIYQRNSRETCHLPEKPPLAQKTADWRPIFSKPSSDSRTQNSSFSCDNSLLHFSWHDININDLPFLPRNILQVLVQATLNLRQRSRLGSSYWESLKSWLDFERLELQGSWQNFGSA